jgi:pyruvate,water dikinase
MCGQAVSTYPELVRNLVSWGVTSVSVSPDAIDATRKLLAQTEKQILNK